MEKNPFEILGFNPKILKKLSYIDDIKKIVRTQYYSLVSIWQPYKERGDAEMFKMMTEAYEKLTKSDENLKNYLEDFTTPISTYKKIKRLESIVKKEGEKTRIIMQNLVDFFAYFSKIKTDKATIFSISDYKLQMLDYVPFRQSWDPFSKPEFKRKYLYELNVLKNGTVIKKKKGKKEKYEDKIFIGCLPQIIDDDKKPLLDLPKKDKYPGRLSYESNPAEGFVKNLCTEENFLINENFDAVFDFLLLMKPQLMKFGYLVSMRNRNNNLYLTIDGEILEIEKK